jgi:2-polyprenyl-6-methoxyphenol hydroxylase-like FAD-dependent oxidoreductase
MQFHQAHCFRGQVADVLDAEMPDILDALTGAGATIVTDADGGAAALLCRRIVFERVLRAQAARQPGLTFVTGHVDRVRQERGRAVGVEVQGRALDAELVIDASGRTGRALRDVRAPGEGSPCGAAYVSRQYRLHDGAEPGPVNGPIGLSLGFDGYFAALFLHDNRTFSVTITHHGSDPRIRRLRHAAVHQAAVRAIPLLADWITPERAHAISPVLPGGQLYNGYRRQLDDRGHPVLPGLVSVGDAVCTTTPLAGRGVTLAVQQAQALVTFLANNPTDIELATATFDDWCRTYIRPWYQDHVRCDTDRMRRWAGGDVDLTRPLPSDLIVAAAGVDPVLRGDVQAYERMRALPSSLDRLQARARAVYASGWRPAPADGPTHEELAQLCVTEGTEMLAG